MKGFVYLLCDGEKFKIGMTKNKIEKRIKGYKTKITEKEEKINKLKATYTIKQGRPPKNDKNACKNQEDRKKLKKEKSKLKTKLSECKKELKEILYYKEKIKIMFKSKTMKTAMKRFNKMWDKKEELPSLIHDFLKRED